MLSTTDILAGMAERAVRHAAADQPPADAGLVAQVRQAVRGAYAAGRAEALAEVLALWRDFTETDDLDRFVEELSLLAHSRETRI